MPLRRGRRQQELPPDEFEEEYPPPKVIYLPPAKTPLRTLAELGLIAAGVIGLVGAVWVHGQAIAVLQQVQADQDKRISRLEDAGRPAKP